MSPPDLGPWPGSLNRAKELRYVRPRLYQKQEAAFFCDERISIVEASTKSGKSVGGRTWLFEQALPGRPGQQFWWLDPTYAMAYDIGFQEMRASLPRGFAEPNEGRLHLTLRHNGAILAFKGTENPDGLYGRDVYAAVLDEATRMKEAAWIAVQTTLSATNGPIRIVGNVRGRKNWAYKLAREAEKGMPGMRYAKLIAADAIAAGILSAEAVEDARRMIPDIFFRELYLAEPATDSGSPFRGIRECIKPLHSSCPVVAWGVDLGRAQSWTVLAGLCVHGCVAAFYRYQWPWPETIRHILATCGEVDVYVDATHGSVGDPVAMELQRDGRENFVAFQFTSASKQALMEGLALAIEHRQVGYPEGPIVIELESFEYEYRPTGIVYKASEGSRDDCVAALGLAWAMWQRRPAPMRFGLVGEPESKPKRVVVSG